jgi:hypothetical protein
MPDTVYALRFAKALKPEGEPPKGVSLSREEKRVQAFLFHASEFPGKPLDDESLRRLVARLVCHVPRCYSGDRLFRSISCLKGRVLKAADLAGVFRRCDNHLAKTDRAVSTEEPLVGDRGWSLVCLEEIVPSVRAGNRSVSLRGLHGEFVNHRFLLTVPDSYFFGASKLFGFRYRQPEYLYDRPEDFAGLLAWLYASKTANEFQCSLFVVTGSLLKKNRELIRRRSEVFETECPHGQSFTKDTIRNKRFCYDICYTGRDVCDCSVRPLTFQTVSFGRCVKCGKEGMADPFRSENVCVDCLAKER